MADVVVPAARGGADLTTFGEPLIALIAPPGVPLAVATSFHRTVVGSEISVAVGVARGGHSVSYGTRLGADVFGDLVLRTLLAEGISTKDVIVDETAPTGLLVRDAHAERAVEVAYYRAGSAASRLSVADVDLTTLTTARMLYATGITPLLSESCELLARTAIRTARDAGTLVAFDPNLRRRLLGPGRTPAFLLEFAELTDLVLTGLDEGRAITGAETMQDVAGVFLGLGARLVVVKLGKDGAWATDGSAAWIVSAQPAAVVDPVGAGDAFNAGFLSALLSGSDVETALLDGNRLGRLAVQAVGDMEGLPSRRQLAEPEPGWDVIR
jgi:2-dehydro-3-deoxygluconokinase